MLMNNKEELLKKILGIHNKIVENKYNLNIFNENLEKKRDDLIKKYIHL